MLEETEGVTTNDKSIYCTKFADGIASVVKSETEMHKMLKNLTNSLKQFKFKINSKWNKILVPWNKE